MYPLQQRLPLKFLFAAGIFFQSAFGAAIATNTTSEKLGPAAFGATVYTTRTIDKIGSSAGGDTDQVTVTMYAEGRYDTIYDYDTLYDTAWVYDTLYDTTWAYDTLYDTTWTYDTLYDTTRKPIDVVLGLDLSTSMAGVDSTIDPERRPRIVWTKLAALHFLDSLKPGDRVAVMGWTATNQSNITDTSNNRRYFHKWCDFTTDFNIVRSFIRDSLFIDSTVRIVDTVEGQVLVVRDNIPNGTFMYTPLRISSVITASHLSNVGRSDATRAVIMLTDGSNNDLLAQSVPVALLDSLYRTQGQRYYAIGFVAGDTTELRSLTSAGGGTYYHASNISELDSAYGALAEMLVSERFDTTVSTTEKYDTSYSTTEVYDTTVSTTAVYDTTVSTTAELDTTISTTPTFDTAISTSKVQVMQDTVVGGLDAVLLFDNSGSMSGTRIEAAKQAGHDFVGMLGDSDRVAVLSFGYWDAYDTIANFTPYSGFGAVLAAMDAQLNAYSGNTAVWYATMKAMEYAQMNMRTKAQPALVVLTDGEDNNSGYSGMGGSSSAAFDSLMRFLTPLGSRVPIFTISLGTSTNASQLQAIATATGGSYYQVVTAGELSAIYQEIAEVIINNVGARSVRIAETVPPAYTYIAGSQAAGPANMTVFDSMYSVTGAGGTTLTWTAQVLAVWDTLQAQYRIFVPAANAGDTLSKTIVSDIRYQDNEYQDHEIVFGNAPPARPSLVSPEFYATDVPLTPTLIWNKVSTAQTFRVMVSLNSNFSTPIVNASLISDTSYTPGVLLTYFTKYYWRVNSTNTFGTSAWSSVWNFTTVPVPPDAPVLSSPANGSTNVSLTPTLSWNQGTGATPTSYQVQVATDLTFASPVFDSTDSASTRNRTLSGLSANTTYYWRAKAINAGGSSAWSGVWSFTTVPPPPDVPVLASPLDSSANQPVSGLTLRWNAAARAATYRVQVSTVSDFSILSYYYANVSGTSLRLGAALAYQTTYYWRVSATNGGGTSAWSAVWSFSTMQLPPDVPVLSLPADGSTDQLISGLDLSWNAAARAVNYRVQVSKTSDFALIFSDTNVAAPAVSLAVSGMEHHTTYYWRVSASNNGGTSAWSSVWNYTTGIFPPGAASLLSPADSATDLTLAPTLSWSAPDTGGAPSSYEVQVSSDTTFAAPVFDSVVSSAVMTLTASGLSGGTTYYWRVKSINGGGDSWSEVWSYTTTFPPAAPILISPVNGAADVSITPTLVWDSSARSARYMLQVATDSSFVSIIFSDSSLTSTLPSFGSLINSTTYYWRVSARNAGGNSGWSTVWSFTTVFGLPGTPTLVSPSDGATDVSINPDMRWNSVAGAATYNLQVSTDSTFATTVYDNGTLTGNAVTIGPLANNTTHYWRVNSTNPCGTSAWSSVWSFTTIIAAPGAVALLSPTDGAVNVVLDPTLSWSAPVSGGAPSSYQVQASIDPTFAILVSDSTMSSSTMNHTLSCLSSSTTYYWRVRTLNAGGSEWSAVWSFTTIPAPPDVPVLASPTNGSVDQPVTGLALSWEPSARAVTYRVQVSTVGDFATTVNDTMAAAPTVSLSVSGMANQTTYYWRVNATNPGGTSAWSIVWSFTTIIAAPGAVALLSPADGVVKVVTDPTLSWSAPVTGGAPSLYRVHVSPDSTFATQVSDYGVTAPTTTLDVSGLIMGTTYYWRVNASNPGGTSAWSVVWRFTTILTAPGAPVLLSPADGAVNVVTDPTLSWSAAASGAPSWYYIVHVSPDSTFATQVSDYGVTAPTTTLDVSGLMTDTTYYWRVSALNPAGRTWSGTWNFTTSTPPGTPMLVSPANGATNQPVSLTLVWAQATNAASYHLQVATDSGFTSMFAEDSLLTDTQKVVSGLSNSTNCYWRVRAKNSGGIVSNWAGYSSFTTIITLPVSVVIVSPADSTFINVDSVRLVWNTAAPSVDRYLVEVSTDTNMTSLVINDSSVTDTTRLVMSLVNKTTYYWRVKAHNAAGWGSYSAETRFVTSFTGVLYNGSVLRVFAPRFSSGKLQYTIPSRCYVSVKYYDFRGRMVGSFINQTQSAGHYSLAIPVSSWAVGAYVQVFEAGVTVRKDRIIMIK